MRFSKEEPPTEAPPGHELPSPAIPRPRENGRTALLWLRGSYRAYTDYDLDVVGLLK